MQNYAFIIIIQSIFLKNNNFGFTMHVVDTLLYFKPFGIKYEILE